MDSNTLRKKFLEFFQMHEHKIMPSDSLLPGADTSVLFTSAGMNQFKNQFLGIDVKSPRVATCQKCLRTDDLIRVGKTAGHHTFFEMLGNFSFGDYFKKDAIELAWQFLTEWLSIDKDKLWISVYKLDEESFKIWRDNIGIDEKKIVKLAHNTNFWPSDPNVKGPCGPCSEIFYDLGENFHCGRQNCSPQCDCGGKGFVEVWNLVFTQFQRLEKGKLRPLSQKNIDTGMGLERLSAVMQNVSTNFQTDLFVPIISEISKLVPKKSSLNEAEKRFRLNAIADHLRAICFAISDGVYPSNEDRGYVIRSLIRRSFLFGRELGIDGSFLYKLVDSLVQVMANVYPELESQRENIAAIIQSEEGRFISSLEIRLPEFIEAVKELAEKGIWEVPAQTLFKFYDTFGLPWDLMEKEAKKFKIKCNKEKFSKLLDKQRRRSRDASQISTSIFEKLYDFKRGDIEFIDKCSICAKVIAIFREEAVGKKLHVAKAQSPERVDIVLDKTPFYAQSGGQVGDTGNLENQRVRIEIVDTKIIEGTIMHKAKILKGEVKVNDEVQASIDIERRLAIARNHTATHLLQAALRKILGPHVRQQGSLVTDRYLRFDFTHPKAIKKEELEEIEDLVNDSILSNDKLKKEFTSLENAKRSGALAFFGERYQDSVRVVSIADYSKELCGGSHLDSTGQISFFKIMKESSVASGIRRIVASTEKYARDFQREKKKKEAEELTKKQKEYREKTLKKQRYEDKEQSLRAQIGEFLSQAQELGKDIKCISAFIEDCDHALLRRLTDFLKEKEKGLIIVLASILEKRAIFVVRVSDDLVKQGYLAASKNPNKGILRLLIARITEIGGLGSGGGSPKLAQGSCTPDKIRQLIKDVPKILKTKIDEIKK